MRKKASVSFTFVTLQIILLVAYNTYPCLAEQTNISSTLNINVVTDKQVYNVGENVQIYGNLTFSGIPVTNGLVALQIDTANNTPFIFRTLPTGDNITGNWNIEILEVFIGTFEGAPLSSVKIGSKTYVWIFFRNNCPVGIYTTIAFTIYDAEKIPLFALAPISLVVEPNSTYFNSHEWIVPKSAKLGNATVYASAFTSLPRNGGVPYCPENSSIFTIVNSTTSTYPANPAVYSSSLTGNYNSTFNLPTVGTTLGNYTIYVASFYLGRKATATTTFKIILLGDVNFDGKVDAKDVASAVKAYGSYPGSPNWNQNADINNDGKVDAKDIAIIIKNYGKHT